MLQHACPPIQYRSLVDVAKVPAASVKGLQNLPYYHRPALTLAMTQSLDGSWHGSMLGVPSARAEAFEGVGTINAVRRLLEYGWDRESPPLAHARRLLFRLLAEDEDPALLYDLAPKMKGADADLIRRGRMILREAAAATLAQAGYEGDPRLGGAARRIAIRIGDYLRSPLAEKPWMRIGNQHVLSGDAHPPSIHTLVMLAYMPLFRSEHHDLVFRVYKYITQQMPRQDPVQQVGKHIVDAPHLILGDPLPHRNAADADVPFALMWLELMARIGFLKRNEMWSKLFQRFLDDRDHDGVWHPHKGMATPRSTSPYVWSWYPLDGGSGTEDRDVRWTDFTFRLGLIARLAGRQIDLV